MRISQLLNESRIIWDLRPDIKEEVLGSCDRDAIRPEKLLKKLETERAAACLIGMPANEDHLPKKRTLTEFLGSYFKVSLDHESSCYSPFEDPDSPEELVLYFRGAELDIVIAAKKWKTSSSTIYGLFFGGSRPLIRAINQLYYLANKQVDNLEPADFKERLEEYLKYYEDLESMLKLSLRKSST